MLQQGLLFFKIQCFEEQKKALPSRAALFTKSYNYKFCKFYTLLLSSCGERFLAAQNPDRDGQGLEYLFCLPCRVFCRPDEAQALPAIQGRDDAQVVTAFDDAVDEGHFCRRGLEVDPVFIKHGFSPGGASWNTVPAAAVRPGRRAAGRGGRRRGPARLRRRCGR